MDKALQQYANLNLIIKLFRGIDATHIVPTISKFHNQWTNAWKNTAQLSRDSLLLLLTTLSRIPFSVSDFSPPPISDCAATLARFLNESLHPADADADNPTFVLQQVEVVVNVIQRLLKFRWENDRQVVKDAIEDVLELATSCLVNKISEHRKMNARIADMFEDLEKPWTIKVVETSVGGTMTLSKMKVVGGFLKSDGDPGDIDDSNQYDDQWKAPTIKWLSTAKRFAPPNLPVMKVPSDKRTHGVYESVHDYFDTVMKLWIGLTFGDGNAALSPTCRHRGGDGQDNTVVACCNRFHADSALCHLCSTTHSTALRGAPSPKSSTHVYDATVSNINFEGVLHLQGVMSRRPPQVAVSWKHTRRLCVPNLVGVVLLKNGRGAALGLEDRVHWAEIVTHGYGRQFEEYKERERGKVAIQLIEFGEGKGDVAFKKGDTVAVIDCQTFVPEFIPILKALEIQQQAQLPFKNGRLLNIGPTNTTTTLPSSSQDHDSTTLLETTSPIFPASLPEPTVDFLVTDSEIRRKVLDTIETSELDPLVQIRREYNVKMALAGELCALVEKATLDPGQMEAWMEALRWPVHCTQGPPGTGKSYLGVTIVRALLLIRKHWIRVCPSIGRPPLLVLSYKNHAIDEFLIDLTKPGGSGGAGRVDLVRVGSCKDPRLERYSETRMVFGRVEVERLRKGLEGMFRRLKEVQEGTTEKVGRMLLGCVEVLDEEEGGEDSKSLAGHQRKVGYEAASILATLLAKIQHISKQTTSFPFDTSSTWTTHQQFVESLPALDSAAAIENLLAGMAALEKTEPDQEMVRNLYEGIKHYDPTMAVGEILWKWMQGFVPQPQCIYINPELEDDIPETRCEDVAEPGSQLCKSHMCHFGNGGCGNAVVPFKPLCHEHPAQEAVNPPPRHTCENHPLCAALETDGWPCESFCVVPDMNYCERHKPQQCRGLTKRGNACQSFSVVSRDRPYCYNHIDQAPPLQPPSFHRRLGGSAAKQQEEEEDFFGAGSTRRCLALTTKGKPCKGTPMPNADLCFNHKNYKLDTVSSTTLQNTLAVPDNARTPSLVIKEYPTDFELVPPTHIFEPPQNPTLPPALDDTSTVQVDVSGWDTDTELTTFDVDAVDRLGGWDNVDELEEPEHLQHIRDVYGIDDLEEDEAFLEAQEGLFEAAEKEEEVKKAKEEGPTMESFEELRWVSCSEWSWGMGLKERWAVVQRVADFYVALNGWLERQLKESIRVERVKYHDEKVKASSRVYEGKEVIGGTIVGCITRLEAIRAQAPFAILIEEASEVMEPLLFSCLSPSTVKLEMIGDHLQLQPSIMSKFDFEKINKINVSMFERLIRAPEEFKVPSTVLSIQRRMRKNIADLTRSFYQGITVIEDHPICNTKKIGDALKSTSFSSNALQVIRSSATQGREVPGVLPHIFFWSHEGTQGKADVGLSKVNRSEANMVCHLAAYLHSCGVPKQSMAILTPYKGQLMLMRRDLINKKLINPQAPDNSVALSTVDRFQGDEADVVIISLVIDAKSKTPFVKLVNRMIVLLSRARIGMYIVGNPGYFDSQGVEHWKKTLTLLNAPADCDTKPPLDTFFNAVRVGNALPICCPSHSKGSNRLNQYIGGSSRTLQAALDAYKCDVKVDVRLPCGHESQLTCAAETDIATGKSLWPKCKKPAHEPFTYSRCKHSIQVDCETFQIYAQNPAKVPVCQEMVSYTPVCGHAVDIKCYLHEQYTSGSVAFTCAHKSNVQLPRCGHSSKVTCGTAVSLRQWTGVPCVDQRVFEGIAYGSKDYDCKNQITFVRGCGHESKVSCGTAFDLAKIKSVCDEKEVVESPFCGHRLEVACHEKQALEKVKADPLFVALPSPVQLVEESNLAASFPSKPSIPICCTQSVTFRRACGHEEQVECDNARNLSKLGPCKVQVETTSPLCGHLVPLKCCDAQNPPSPFPDSFTESASYHRLMNERILDDLSPVPNCPPYLLQCKAQITLRLTSRCGHDISLPCFEAWKAIQTRSMPSCDQQSLKVLKCGHQREFACSDFESYMSGKIAIECDETLEKPCWNVDSCHQFTKAACSSEGVWSCDSLTKWTCSAGLHTFNIQICSKGFPNGCPECILKNVEDEIAVIEKYEEDGNFPKLDSKTLPPPFDALLKFPGCSAFDLTFEMSERFYLSKSRILSSFLTWLRSNQPWKRTLYHPQLIPILYMAQGRMRLDSSHPEKLASQHHAFGVRAFELTKDALSHVFEYFHKTKNPNLEYTLVFGWGFTCNTLVETQAISNKPKNEWMKMFTKAQVGHDALQLFNTNSIIFLDPYCVYFTHMLMIQKRNAKRLQDVLVSASKDRPLLSSSTIKFELPQGHLSDLTPKQAADAAEKSRSAAELIRKVDLLSGISIADFWNGRSFTLIDKALDSRIETELKKKTRFANINIPNNSGGGVPFGGIKYLSTLIENHPTTIVELTLMKSLEFLCLGESCLQDAEKSLNEYLQSVKRTHSKAHPLLLLAVSRLLKAKGPLLSSSKDLIKAYSIFNPKATQWLSKDELAYLKDVPPTVQKGSKVLSEREIWEELKSKSGCSSTAMDELIELTGLKKVKRFAIQMFKAALSVQKIPAHKRKVNGMTFNYCFLGNPDSGKTTVARLFARILHDSKTRQSDVFVECNAQQLKDEGAEAFRKKAAKAKGGVLFVDEAYDLDPKGDLKGKPIVSELLTLSENERDSISIILAGYADDMQDKLFSYNDGLKSRFEEVFFEDFDESDLNLIWTQMVEGKGWNADEKIGKLVAKRLALMSGKKGFGNARAVRNVFESAVKKNMARDDFDSNMTLRLQDVVGDRPSENPKLQKVLEELNQQIGWKSIKEMVKNLVELAERNYDRELQGLHPLPFPMNKLMLGNPGTGKTTAASLYGQILKHLNFLSNGDVVLKAASDFVGQYVGESQKKTNSILASAAGKVLVIDEAYALDDNLYGKQVLDVLVEKIQGTASDNICVLLLGYEKQMLDMIRRQNPGLSRRFSPEQAFKFEDFDDNELFQIFNLNCKKESIDLSSYEVCERAIQVLSRQRNSPNFGNAGALKQLLHTAIVKASARPQKNPGRIMLEPDDIDTGLDRSEDPFAFLNTMYRVEKIREKLEQLKSTFQLAIAEGGEVPSAGHYVFRGSPGTGKTTVARAMAKILFQLEVLGTDRIIETSGLDLTGEYLGQTKVKVQEKLGQAKGGVLFIDEAYELGKGIYGEEAMTVILEAMTSPDYKGMVIIIAGYQADIDIMLNRNAGLKSRFTNFFDFEDWFPKDSTEYFLKLAEKDNFAVDSGIQPILLSGFGVLKGLKGWANGRDVIRLFKDSVSQRAKRLGGKPEAGAKTLVVSDVQFAMQEMMAPRMTEAANSTETMDRHGHTLAPPPTYISIPQNPRLEEIVDEDAEQEQSESASDDDPVDDMDVNFDPTHRDDGVTDEQWEELEKAKKELKAKMDQLRKDREDEAKREAALKAIARQNAIQENIRKIMPCPMGFAWSKVGGGWRCAGGSHYVSDAQLAAQFTV
ncbi:hypothetical protein HDV05_005146 [Chytridiales sp. JEL 0842]|nr:hypothetical protein HDV05_005146 [Chytridiales sp. JEL 0842]